MGTRRKRRGKQKLNNKVKSDLKGNYMENKKHEESTKKMLTISKIQRKLKQK